MRGAVSGPVRPLPGPTTTQAFSQAAKQGVPVRQGSECYVSQRHSVSKAVTQRYILAVKQRHSDSQEVKQRHSVSQTVTQRHSVSQTVTQRHSDDQFLNWKTLIAGLEHREALITRVLLIESLMVKL